VGNGSVLVAELSFANLGLPALVPLMAAMEAGLPIPIPLDLVVLVLGERAAAGSVPLWLAAIALEVVALAGTAALLLLCRGPARAVVTRFGPRIGLTPERLGRATALVADRGRSVLAVGRATPGLRTVTVVAAGSSGMSVRRALPALVVGSSVFLQLHLVLGFLLGPLARDAVKSATGPALAVLAAVAVAGVVVWIVRRGRREGAQSATEACCPACMALGLLVPKAAALQDLV
jgi:membrane protein DedA with SNARE-associated domain